ncbi:MAG: stage V sporulation protein T [Eubacteriales bacterium]
MKATGIVRRIDDLGRVVIPKEIRRTLRIRQNEPLEIFTDRNGEVILKKYSPIGELGQFAEEYAEALNQSLGHIACIADKDAIIAVAGTPKKQLMNKQVANDVEKVMEERKVTLYSEPCSLVYDEEPAFKSAVMAPIITEGDVIGAVILATRESGVTMGQLEQKMVETAASFLGKQMES